MNAAEMRVNKTLVRREFWENRSLWIVPAAAIAILTVLSLYMLVAVLWGHSQSVNTIDMQGTHFYLDNLPDFAAADPAEVRGIIRATPLMLSSFLFSPMMQIVVFFYLLDSLYADRRDRSILFWRSMPVSDLRTVLSKLATAVLAATGIVFVATIAFELILLVLELIMGGVLGVHLWVVLEHPLTFIESWVMLAYGLLCQAVWYLPYYGWVILASSWAKKTPFLWAVLTPLGVMFAEAWVFHTGHIAKLVFGHNLRWAPLAFNIDMNMSPKPQLADMLSFSRDLVTPESVGRFLLSPELWVGLVLTVGFIAGAVWLRRNRSEI